MLVLLEPLALRLAIPHLGLDDFVRADAALDALRARARPGARRVARWRFHAALYTPSGPAASGRPHPPAPDWQAARYGRRSATKRRGAAARRCASIARC